MCRVIAIANQKGGVGCRRSGKPYRKSGVSAAGQTGSHACNNHGAYCE